MDSQYRKGLFIEKRRYFEGKVIRTEFPNKGIIDIEGQKVIVKKCVRRSGSTLLH